jgi:hypothetical protein
MAERSYDLPPHERDRIILTLRNKGYPLSVIAARVGMSRGGVSRALARMDGLDDEDE